MKRVILAVCVVLGVSVPLEAQTIDKWQLRVYNTGAAAPLSTTDLQAAAVTCGLTTGLVGSTINPNKVGFDDPVTAARFCLWTDPGTGVLNSLPFGAQSYDGTLAAVAGTVSSPESARAAFTRPGVAPTAPTNLRIVR